MKHVWRVAAILAATVVLAGLGGCTGSNIEEGMPKDATYKAPPIDPSTAVTGGGTMGQYKKAMAGGGKAEAEKKAP